MSAITDDGRSTSRAVGGFSKSVGAHQVLSGVEESRVKAVEGKSEHLQVHRALQQFHQFNRIIRGNHHGLGNPSFGADGY